MKRPAFIFLFITYLSGAFCQGLETIPPVLIAVAQQKIDTGVSFVLTPNLSAIEIIDASEPWPPRWYVPAAAYNNTTTTKPDDSLNRTFRDARFQNGIFTFCQLHSFPSPFNKRIKEAGYIMCNSRMEPIDTFIGADLPLNAHECRINAHGEKLIADHLDTTLNMSSVTGDPGDTAIIAMVDVIEIVDVHNKTVFRWNPVQALGINTIYMPYGRLVSRSSKPGFLDWSHANSLAWDFDGNILYSFRHVGVGKISRQNGSVIWRLDRNKMPYDTPGGKLEFYQQHAIDKLEDNKQYNTYTLYTTGEKNMATPGGVIFAVSKKDGKITLVKNKKPVVNYTGLSSGNYEIWSNGDYILNYGESQSSNNDSHIFMEYGDKHDSIYAEYRFTGSINTFSVHATSGWKPPRPEIVTKGATLSAQGEMQEWTWYKLEGAENINAIKTGEGKSFTPKEPGLYCVVGKYGIGYSVSLPYNLKRP